MKLKLFKKGFTRLVKALRENLSPAKLTQSLSRFSLTGLRFARPSAFTLAEVLITLSILGVIAALTVPSIYRNFQDRMTITKVKKNFAVFDNALRIMFLENGYPEQWSCDNFPNSYYCFADKMEKYFKIKATDSETGYNVSIFKTLKNNDFNLFASYSGGKAWLLNDGTFVYFHTSTTPQCQKPSGASKCEMNYGEILFDINGNKGPNRLGYDVFFMGVYKKGILRNFIQGSSCSLNASNTWWDGRSCFDWIIKNNNMDYKYRDVSAEW